VAQAGAAGSAGTRNTPSLLNRQGARWLGWDGAHDSLWAASRAPLMAADEMGHSVASLAQVVRAAGSLERGYRSAFARPLPASDEELVVDVAKALAAFQATLRTPRTPFDAFRDALVRGDLQAAAAYPLSAQRGLRLFVGQARCSVCHAGPAFTNGEFADIGIPFFVAGGVDPGRHAGLLKLQGSLWNRLGPYNDAAQADPQAVTTRHVVMEPRHFGEFRVPGLRHLSQTAPYMHNGSLPTVEAVVQHYSQLDENRLHADGERILRRLALSPGEAADLAAFLRSLGP
jgi:cytochrome c peroxidase